MIRRWTPGVLVKYLEILNETFRKKAVIETKEVRDFCRQAHIPTNVVYIFLKSLKASGLYLPVVRGFYVQKEALKEVEKIINDTSNNSKLAMAVKSEYVRTRQAMLFSGKRKIADAHALVSAVRVYQQCQEHWGGKNGDIK